MSIGVAFSGGGISAAVGGACAWNAFVDTYPFSNVTLSTVSGGSIGYGLWVNAKHKIHFPRYQKDVTMEALMKENTFDNENGEFISLLPNWVQKKYADSKKRRQLCESNDNETKISVGEIVNELFSSSFVKDFFSGRTKSNGRKVHWWTSVVQRIFDVVCVGYIRSGETPWIASFGFVNKTQMLERNVTDGTLLPSSAERLHQVNVNMTSGDFAIPAIRLNKQLKRQWNRTSISIIDALSYSSAFWATSILTREMPFIKTLLLSANADLETSDAVYVVDGGVIDTTGIVALLQRNTKHIIAFYNNNVPLNDVESSFAYLFGCNTKTDAMNSLKGASLSQVFPSELYPGVIADLNDPKAGIAILRDVRILPNQMGVEPYTLETLVIFTNGRYEQFALDDAQIIQRTSPRWPNNFRHGLPMLDANLLCMLNDWKVRNHRREIFDSILGTKM